MEVAFTAALAAVLATITVVDVRRYVIPDPLNVTLALLGAGFQIWQARAVPTASVLFAAAVTALFWAVGEGYRVLRGRTGLGRGDVKMAGATAFWFSPWNLPLFLLASCCAALLFVLFLGARGRVGPDTRIPFGPFLAVGLATTWLAERWGLPTFIPDSGP